jgi:DNA-binding transcriptional ArsR family regulator
VTEPRIKHVTDLAGLRALGHPLRLRLLGLLRIHGPATASSLGREVGAAPNAVSYHLRQLAQAGFIEPAGPPTGDRREHAWQASQDLTTWERSSFASSAEADVALDALRREIFDVYREVLERYLRTESEWDDAWREAAGFGDLLFRATPDELAAVRAEVEAVVERHRLTAASQPDRPGTEMVQVIWHAFPHPADR